MFGKRVGAMTGATKSDTETAFRDRGAMSGLLTGVGFIAGVGGGVALADSPYPRPPGVGSFLHRWLPGRSRAAGDHIRRAPGAQNVLPLAWVSACPKT